MPSLPCYKASYENDGVGYGNDGIGYEKAGVSIMKKKMNKEKLFLLGSLINTIIKAILYILILEHIKATTIIWLLFWIAVPLDFILNYLVSIWFKIDIDIDNENLE